MKRILRVVDRKFLGHVLNHSRIKPHKCHLCEKAFTKNDSLQKHILTHNGQNKNVFKRHKCGICRAKFADTRNLTRHLMTHSGMKFYQCHVCEKAFTRNDNLKRHISTHKGATPQERKSVLPMRQQCGICKKTFKRTDDLRRHVVTHYDNENESENNEGCEYLVCSDHEVNGPNDIGNDTKGFQGDDCDVIEFPNVEYADDDVQKCVGSVKDFAVFGLDAKDSPVLSLEGKDSPVLGLDGKDSPVSGIDDKDSLVLNLDGKDSLVSGLDGKDSSVFGLDGKDSPDVDCKVVLPQKNECSDDENSDEYEYVEFSDDDVQTGVSNVTESQDIGFSGKDLPGVNCEPLQVEVSDDDLQKDVHGGIDIHDIGLGATDNPDVLCRDKGSPQFVFADDDVQIEVIEVQPKLDARDVIFPLNLVRNDNVNPYSAHDYSPDDVIDPAHTFRDVNVSPDFVRDDSSEVIRDVMHLPKVNFDGISSLHDVIYSQDNVCDVTNSPRANYNALSLTHGNEEVCDKLIIVKEELTNSEVTCEIKCEKC